MLNSTGRSGSAGRASIHRDVPIEAARYNTFLMGAGLRYFFMEAMYLGIYTVQNPLQRSQKDFIQGIYGLELSVQI